ncbi:MAG TPA: murein biosynthesis integral membrane protein MurJ [Patescibacteria group bacterium]|nr:murein biosynthesis integral membrane protein MurJ [Patescibacteria group bacterium]
MPKYLENVILLSMEFIKNIFKKLNGSTTGSAIVIAIFSILSKLLGLLRDRLLAARFGAGDVLDAYYAAFKLPDFIFNTLVLGALSAAFIPLFIELKARHSHKNSQEKNGNLPIEQTEDELIISSSAPARALNNMNGSSFNHWDLSAAVINVISLVLIVLGAVVWLFAPQFVTLIAPGFSGAKMALTVQMTKIMLISVLFFGISNVFSGILQSLRKFTVFSLAPLMYNLGIIFGLVFLVNIFGDLGLAYGVVLGAFLHLIIQWPAVRRAGFHWQSILALKNKAVRQIGKLMLPRTVGLAGNQLNQVITTIIASGLISGSLAIFNLASNLGSVPISIFAVSLAVATFPSLSESFIQKDKAGFIAQISLNVRRILYLMIPISVFMIALRAQIVRLVLGSGSFDWEDTILTADSLGYFAISLFAQGLIPLLARAFYAFQNTKIPVIISLIAVVLNIIGSVVLAPIMGVTGLALAFSLASIVNVVLLIVILRHKLGDLQEKKIVLAIIKICVSAIGGLVFIQLAKYGVANLVGTETFLAILLQFISAFVVGTAVFVLVSIALGSEETLDVRNYLFKRSKKINYE